MKFPSDRMKIGVVGPCAAGKSTLIQGLKSHSLRAHQIAQEHSYVPRMWQLIGKVDYLIYLEASYASTLARKNLNWNEAEYQQQLARLAHARQHCDLFIPTDDLSPAEILHQALTALEGHTTPVGPDDDPSLTTWSEKE